MVLESKIGQYNSLVHIRSLQEKRSTARAAFNGILLFVDDKKITEIAKGNGAMINSQLQGTRCQCQILRL